MTSTLFNLRMLVSFSNLSSLLGAGAPRPYISKFRNPQWIYQPSQEVHLSGNLARMSTSPTVCGFPWITRPTLTIEL
jgi:hypothetical protein